MADRQIVILAHAADRTGPPVYLLQLLRALDRPRGEVVVVLLRGGDLLPELQALAEVRVVGEPVDRGRANPVRLAEEPARVAARRAQLADLTEAPLVVVNTAWSIHALPWLHPATSSRRVVSVVHELGAGVAELLEPPALDALLASDRFVAGCRAVSAMLTGDLAVDPARVDLIPYGVEIGPDPQPVPRALLEADDTAFLVVAAAVPDRRKGPDLFVHLAAAARRRRPDVPWAFRWIGSADDDPRLAIAQEDRALLDAAELVRFLPATPDLRAWLAAADAFVLPSRQDAFPLVAVEAALAGLPLLAFATGGLGELVGDDAGALVAFPDVEVMVDHLERWVDQPHERAAAGAAGRARARARHAVEQHAERFRTVVIDRPPDPDEWA